MPTKAFLLGVADRAVKAFAISLASLLAVGPAVNVLHINWLPALGLSGGAALMSVLSSFISLPLGDTGTTAAIPGAK